MQRNRVFLGSPDIGYIFLGALKMHQLRIVRVVGFYFLLDSIRGIEKVLFLFISPTK